MPGICMLVWGSNSDLHAYEASTLPSELSSSLSFDLYLGFLFVVFEADPEYHNRVLEYRGKEKHKHVSSKYLERQGCH